MNEVVHQLYFWRIIMGKYTDSDNENYGGDSSSKVSEAEHDARDHATSSGLFERGNDSKNSTRFKDDTGHATGFWGSIFGSKK